MAKYQISYAYKKPKSSTTYSTSTTVIAETEATAIRIVENKHSGCEVLIRQVKKTA
jgi:hypothetical protein